LQGVSLTTVPNWLFVGDLNGDTLADVAVTSSPVQIGGTSFPGNSAGILLNTTPSFILSLTLAGTGGGAVTSQPAVMNCKSSCIGNFAPGTTLALTATPAAGSIFAGWSGACSGAGTCSLTMNAAASATATFTLQDFSLTPASTTLTVQPGGQGTDVMTMAGLNGPFANSIQLTCTITGPAPMPTCALSATSVTPGSSSVTSTLTITAPTTAALQLPSGRPQLGRSLYTLWLPLMLGITLVGGAKKQHGRYGLFCGLLLLLFLQTACGGSSSSSGIGTTPPTNYTVTVTGAAGTIQHATQVTVTVQ
jgi:hypothetical protein